MSAMGQCVELRLTKMVICARAVLYRQHRINYAPISLLRYGPIGTERTRQHMYFAVRIFIYQMPRLFSRQHIHLRAPDCLGGILMI